MLLIESAVIDAITIFEKLVTPLSTLAIAIIACIGLLMGADNVLH